MPGLFRQLECYFNPRVERIDFLLLEVLFGKECDLVVSCLKLAIGFSRNKPCTAVCVGSLLAEHFPGSFPLHQQLDVNICSRLSPGGIENMDSNSIHGLGAVGLQSFGSIRRSSRSWVIFNCSPAAISISSETPLWILAFIMSSISTADLPLANTINMKPNLSS